MLIMLEKKYFYHGLITELVLAIPPERFTGPQQPEE
jgi:hypothetical protein